MDNCTNGNKYISSLKLKNHSPSTNTHRPDIHRHGHRCAKTVRLKSWTRSLMNNSAGSQPVTLSTAVPLFAPPCHTLSWLLVMSASYCVYRVTTLWFDKTSFFHSPSHTFSFPCGLSFPFFPPIALFISWHPIPPAFKGFSHLSFSPVSHRTPLCRVMSG